MKHRFKMQTLRAEIEARQMPFGDTATGRDWCIKALHPSDPLTEVRGIPDHSAVPSLLMNYQATLTVGAAAGSVGEWSIDATLLPHPIDFMSYTVKDSVNPLGVSYEFNNPQLSGLTHLAKYQSLAALAQRWRLAYASVTVHQDGPSLANQGSIVVSQPPFMPAHVPTVLYCEGIHIMLQGPTTEVFTLEDRPDFNTSQSMPNAYFARSKDGVYVPLKLTETCQDWVSDKDAVTPGRLFWAGTNNNFINPAIGATFEFPHWETEVCMLNPVTDNATAVKTSPMLNATCAHICARNLSVDSRFTFFFRFGIEMQVHPSSTLAPQQKLSPPFDRVALDTYFAIARELKDAYPADYNDLGKIWDAISAAAQNVLPYMKALGPYGQAASLGTRAVLLAGNQIRQARQRKRQQQAANRGNPPAAEVERQQAAQKLADLQAAEKVQAASAEPTPAALPRRARRVRRPRPRVV